MATRTYDGKTTDIYDTNLDPTRQAQAMSQADVNAQDYATRLWQSLDYTYGKQREKSNQQYDQTIGATDRAALQRGMGRSSYTTQTLANLGKQKTDAFNDIYSQQIADYQSRVTEQENADRQLASSYVSAIISAGGTPSDDLLRRAGLSRADALAMVSNPSGGRSGSGTGGNGGNDQTGAGGDDKTPGGDDKTFLDGLGDGNPRLEAEKKLADILWNTPPRTGIINNPAVTTSKTAIGKSAIKDRYGNQISSAKSSKWYTKRDQAQDRTIFNPAGKKSLGGWGN